MMVRNDGLLIRSIADSVGIFSLYIRGWLLQSKFSSPCVCPYLVNECCMDYWTIGLSDLVNWV